MSIFLPPSEPPIVIFVPPPSIFGTDIGTADIVLGVVLLIIALALMYHMLFR